ncbi:MAG: putative Ig domain-containing protein, partial [Gemmatimonadota bacterium]
MKYLLALPRRAFVTLFGATLLLSASLVACSSDQITGLKAPTDANQAIVNGLSLDCPVPSVALMLGVPIVPITVTGLGPSTLSLLVSGLPAGLTMSATTLTGTSSAQIAAAIISGTPTVGGTFNYTLTLNSVRASTKTNVQACSLTVGYPSISASCVNISGVAGSPIAPVTLVASGGSGSGYTFSATGLPAGLSMAANGTISGTPTAGGSTASYSVTITDGAGNTATLTMNCPINIGYPPITASCAAINGVMGSAITPVTISAAGGSGAGYTYTASGLPAGLSMAADGTISGTPTVGGSFTYTVTITDSAGNTFTTTGCTITIGYPPIGASCSAISGVMGAAITPVSIAATGGSGAGYTYSASGLPAGLSMAADGTISGTPTVGGSFTYTVTITDSAGHSYTTPGCTITIGYPPIGASCSAISGVMGSAITPVSIAATGGSGAGYT